MSHISVVVPVYYNEGSIRETCETIRETLSSHPAITRLDFVIVNDGSGDNSLEVMRDLYRESPDQYTIINFSRNFGQLAALLAGYRHATGDCVVSISADLQDPPELIAKMFDAWRNGYKLVVASRSSRNDSFLYDRVASVAWDLFRRFSVPTIPKGGFDFFLMDRELCELYVDNPDQHLFMQGRLLFFGYEPAVIPYERRKRTIGKSKTNLGRKVKYFIDGFVGYSYLPLRVVSAMGVVMFIASFIGAFLVAWYVLLYNYEVKGWGSLMVAMLFLNGIQMLAIGVIGEYLWRTLEETRKRPHYIIQSIMRPEQAEKFDER